MSERPERVRDLRDRMQERVQSIRQKVPFQKLEDLKAFAKQRPYALMAIQTQIMYDMASMLEDFGKTLIDLRQDFNKTIPKGVFRPLDVEVTDQPTVLEYENTPSMPWIAFDIFNDGDSPVYIRVNQEETQTQAPLSKGESVRINMGVPQIEKVTLHCAQGLTAAVRLYAIK